MTIKEALLREPLATIVSPKDSHDLGREYVKEVKQKGIALFKEAHIPEILEELRQIVALDFPDAMISPDGDKRDPDDLRGDAVFGGLRRADGATSIALGWNYGEVRKKSVGGEEYDFKSVLILAQPLHRRIIIEGKETQIIPEALWSAKDGKTILEDAIVKAYKNPKLDTGGDMDMIVD